MNPSNPQPSTADDENDTRPHQPQQLPPEHQNVVEPGRDHAVETSTPDATQQHVSPRSAGPESLLRNQHAVAHNTAASPLLPSIDTTTLAHRGGGYRSSPSSAGLSLQTTILANPQPQQQHQSASSTAKTPTILYETPVCIEPPNQHLTSPNYVSNAVGSSLRSNMSTSSLASSLSHGSGSALPSPYLAALTDITPLPSPLHGGDSLALWHKRRNRTPNGSREGSLDDHPLSRLSVQPTSPDSPSKKKKGYGSLMQEAAIANAQHASGLSEDVKSSTHTRIRSISDFTPEPLHNARPRHVTIGQGEAPNLDAPEYQMHREAHLADQRGLSVPQVASAQLLPTPPPSTSSVAGSDDADDEQPYLEDGTASEFLEIHCGIHNKRRKFRQLRKLGQGTFSAVMLATRERIPSHPTPEIEEHLDPHKLVAIKIVEHGPAGGADEERIEVSLKREVEMLKSVSHPSLIHLKACEYQETRALLVLTYCPGGDLFDFASQKRDLLTPPLIQRMFAELVSAVRYLHVNWIVHRDIKLENVLVNLTETNLRAIENPLTYPTSIITLTDLGLSRKIPEPPEQPLLTTRCGSEDYAAPEILLGQAYDGRSTDAWALGVLLYALMEGRLPFDAPPGKPDRSRNTHRIARCDWIWCWFGDEDGEWDPARGKDFEGAQHCVEGLLKKVRMGRKNLDDIEQLEWVKQGIQVKGGLQMREEDDDL